MKKSLIITGILIAVLLLIQLIRIDKTTPLIDKEQDFMSTTMPPPNVEQILHDACYDCHSYETLYPWYANVAPVSWWIKRHINAGRKELNYSIWNTYSEDKQGHLIEESIDMLEKSWMPLKSYARMHSEAQLTEVQKVTLIDWLQSLE